MRSNEFGSSENVQMKGKRWTGQPETAGYRARRKTIRGVADEQTKDVEPRLLRQCGE